MLDEMTGRITLDEDTKERLDEVFDYMLEHSYDNLWIEEYGITDEGEVEYNAYDVDKPESRYQYFIDLGMLLARVDMCGVDETAHDILRDLASGVGRRKYLHGMAE